MIQILRFRYFCLLEVIKTVLFFQLSLFLASRLGLLQVVKSNLLQSLFNSKHFSEALKLVLLCDPLFHTQALVVFFFEHTQPHISQLLPVLWHQVVEFPVFVLILFLAIQVLHLLVPTAAIRPFLFGFLVTHQLVIVFLGFL